MPKSNNQKIHNPNPNPNPNPKFTGPYTQKPSSAKIIITTNNQSDNQHKIVFT